MAKTLLSFTGFHDPYSTGLVGSEEQPGPILTLALRMGFDRIVLFSTPNTEAYSKATQEALGQACPETVVDVVDCPIYDPTDYDGIREPLEAWVKRDGAGGDGQECFVSIASGTPQMHVVWLNLVAGGQLRARILNTRPPRFVTKDKPLIAEVEVSLERFPAGGAMVRQRQMDGSGFGADLGEPGAAGPAKRRSTLKSLDAEQSPDISRTAAAMGMIGEHPEFLKILEKTSLLAPTRYPVLILGETGTGKELLARLVHQLSGRPAELFVPLNCAAIPRELVESTLFGHKKGAFTGATEDRKGKFDAADGGTLFLDELGDLPVEIQPKLLRVLQDGVLEPVGAARGHKVNVRIVAATNVHLEKAIKSGRLREDLFYRLKVGILHIPALRERRSDIGKIALFVLERINASLRHPKRFSHDALAWLVRRDWAGNIRDLENTIEGAAILTPGQEIGVNQLEMANGRQVLEGSSLAIPEPGEGFSLPEYVSEIRKRLVERALELAGGNQRQAARMLGISPQALSKQVSSIG